MINRIADELLVAARRRSPGLNAVRSADEEQGVGNQVKQWAIEAEKMIATHPGASLAVALGVGVVIGWWLKRT